MKLRIALAFTAAALLAGCTGGGGPAPMPEVKEPGKAPKTSKTAKKPAPKPAAAPRPAPAVTGGVPTYYMSSGKGHIVYATSDRGSGIHVVEVWTSVDGGKWKLYKEDKTGAGRVEFTAEVEGSYDFTTVGVDKIGNREKTVHERTRPDFRVVVDRTAPKVTASGPAVGKLAPAGATFDYSWKALDKHLGGRPVELQARFKKEGIWRTVGRDLAPQGRGKFKLPEAEDDVAEVRFLARDLAGNLGWSVVGSVAYDRVPPVGKILAPRRATTLDVKVRYEVSDPGAAQLSSVTLWITDNNGRSWKKLADAPPKSGEVPAKLPGSGNYGLAVSAMDSAGNQLAPPRRGTKPAFTLSTDKAPPRVTPLAWMQKGQVVSGARPVELKWKAADENLGAKPVSIEFSEDGGRSWKPVAAGLANTGSYSWNAPKDVNSKHCVLRLTVRDVLGNPSQLVSPNFILDNEPPTTEAVFRPLTEEEAKAEEERLKKKRR